MFRVYAAIDLAVLFGAGAFPTMAGMSALSLLTKLTAATLGPRSDPAIEALDPSLDL